MPRVKFTQEEWDAQTADLEADKKRPLRERKYFHPAMGLVLSFLKHLDEEIQMHLDFPDKSFFLFWLRSALNVISDDQEKEATLQSIRERIEKMKKEKSQVVDYVAIHDMVLLDGLLSEIDKLTPKKIVKTTTEKEQLFLGLLDTIEEIAKNNLALQLSNPTLLKAVPALWDSLSQADQINMAKEFDQLVIDYIEKANKLSDKWVDEYRRALDLQPDRESELLKEYRDHYVEQLKGKYQPIRYWYDNYLEIDKSSLAGIEPIGVEVYLFCQSQNRPFIVGLTLIENLYACYLCIQNFNNLINAYLSAPLESDQPKPDMDVSSFEDLFYRQEEIDTCVDALRAFDKEKPLLGEGLTWVGGAKRKGLIVAWIEAMEEARTPKIRKLKNRQLLVTLLNKYFSNLEMGVKARVFDWGGLI